MSYRQTSPPTRHTLGSFTRLFPGRGLIGIFLQEVLAHLLLRYASFNVDLDVWFALFFLPRFGMRTRRWSDLMQKKSGSSWSCKRLSDALSSVLRTHIVPFGLVVVKSTTNPSRSPKRVASDVNLAGLKVYETLHAFNSFQRKHNSMCSSSLRSSAPLHLLSDCSTPPDTSTLLDITMPSALFCLHLFM